MNDQAEQADLVQSSPTGATVAPSTSTMTVAGRQFITGACKKDADCASACCGFRPGKCAGPAVAQEKDGGCGFGKAQPNNNVLEALQRRYVMW